MASSLRTKLRIAASVLFATGFFDAIAGRFLFQTRGPGEATPRKPDPAESDWLDLAGALHIHSTYSDGAGDVPAVMAGAREAGMVDFVLLTDHNTQQPLRDGWEARYENETPFLLIGTEVTVEHGAFLLAMDAPPAWEPTKGQAPQIAIDDIRTNGGFPLVSLPFDVKHPWRDWEATGYDGLEVLNLSTVARRHINFVSLAWLWPIYRTQGMLSVLRALITRPDQALARWDSLTAGGVRQMVGIGALDAHALMKIGKRKYPLPSYADSFRAATTHVRIAREDASDPARRKRAVYAAFRRGRCYFAFDCLGDPGSFVFSGIAQENINKTAVPAVQMGERARCGTILAIECAGSPALIRLLADGKVVAASYSGRLEFTASKPGAYRVEVYQYAGRIGPIVLGARPWIFSNPIYVSETS